ncbi:MAG: hypothetical protein HY720_31040 [Planctomycetes bacterium]|nr:hypothetical protein [Planctomycetota bacterium]
MATALLRERKPEDSSRDHLREYVRHRLETDGRWRQFSGSGAWICPFCLGAVPAGHGDPEALAVSVEAHLGTRCGPFRAGYGAQEPRRRIEAAPRLGDLPFLLVADPAWQIFDDAGGWYCPAGLERIEGVRIEDGRPDEATLSLLERHLQDCPHFRTGSIQQAEAVRAARDRGQRTLELLDRIRSQLHTRIWRYRTGAGEWVCPWCLERVPSVALAAKPDWCVATEGMAAHLLGGCSRFGREGVRIEEERILEAIGEEEAGGLDCLAPPPEVTRGRLDLPVPQDDDDPLFGALSWMDEL